MKDYIQFLEFFGFFLSPATLQLFNLFSLNSTQWFADRNNMTPENDSIEG